MGRMQAARPSAQRSLATWRSRTGEAPTMEAQARKMRSASSLTRSSSAPCGPHRCDRPHRSGAALRALGKHEEEAHNPHEAPAHADTQTPPRADKGTVSGDGPSSPAPGAAPPLWQHLRPPGHPSAPASLVTMATQRAPTTQARGRALAPEHRWRTAARHEPQRVVSVSEGGHAHDAPATAKMQPMKTGTHQAPLA